MFYAVVHCVNASGLGLDRDLDADCLADCGQNQECRLGGCGLDIGFGGVRLVFCIIDGWISAAALAACLGR